MKPPLERIPFILLKPPLPVSGRAHFPRNRISVFPERSLTPSIILHPMSSSLHHQPTPGLRANQYIPRSHSTPQHLGKLLSHTLNSRLNRRPSSNSKDKATKVSEMYFGII